MKWLTDGKWKNYFQGFFGQIIKLHEFCHLSVVIWLSYSGDLVCRFTYWRENSSCASLRNWDKQRNAKTLALISAQILIQKTLRSISLKRQHSRSTLRVDWKVRYCDVQYSASAATARLPYNFFIFCCRLSFESYHAKKTVFSFKNVLLESRTRKKKDSNGGSVLKFTLHKKKQGHPTTIFEKYLFGKRFEI